MNVGVKTNESQSIKITTLNVSQADSNNVEINRLQGNQNI